METLPPQPASRSDRAVRKRVVRWAGLVVLALAAALLFDLSRQALATDRVDWQAVESPPPVAPAAVNATPGTAVDERPRLIRFTAGWCGPCRHMKAQVFSKQAVADAIHARFDAFSVDLTQPGDGEQRWAQRYRVDTIPTLLITDARGREIARLDRAADREEFRAWLDAGWEAWAEQRDSDDAVLTLDAPRN